MTVSCTDNDSQMRALLLHCAGPNAQDIFMHLEDVGTTYKAEMNALTTTLKLKRMLYLRGVFRQAIQRTNESSLNFVTRLRKLASTCEFANPNSEIRDQFIYKCSSNCLRRRLLQEPNLTLENAVVRAQAMELAEMQSIIMQPDEMHGGIARLKVTQDKLIFPSNKCCFHCGSSIHLANKCNIPKGKTCRKCGKERQNLRIYLSVCYKVKAPPIRSIALLSTAH